MLFGKGVGRCAHASVCDGCTFTRTARLLGAARSGKGSFLSLLRDAAPAKCSASNAASWACTLALPHPRTPSHASQQHPAGAFEKCARQTCWAGQVRECERSQFAQVDPPTSMALSTAQSAAALVFCSIMTEFADQVSVRSLAGELFSWPCLCQPLSLGRHRSTSAGLRGLLTGSLQLSRRGLLHVRHLASSHSHHCPTR